jgi:allantoicase
MVMGDGWEIEGKWRAALRMAGVTALVESSNVELVTIDTSLFRV